MVAQQCHHEKFHRFCNYDLTNNNKYNTKSELYVCT